MSVNNNQKRRIRQALYSLKKQYGAGPFEVYELLSSTTNPQTGAVEVETNIHLVRKAILLPSTLKREVTQTISVISGNKSFVYGGGYDRSMVTVIFEKEFLPLDTIDKDDWFVFQGKKYEIHQIEVFDLDTAWVVQAKHLLLEEL